VTGQVVEIGRLNDWWIGWCRSSAADRSSREAAESATPAATVASRPLRQSVGRSESVRHLALMRPIATRVARSVVCVLGTPASPAKQLNRSRWHWRA